MLSQDYDGIHYTSWDEQLGLSTATPIYDRESKDKLLSPLEWEILRSGKTCLLLIGLQRSSHTSIAIIRTKALQAFLLYGWNYELDSSVFRQKNFEESQM